MSVQFIPILSESAISAVESSPEDPSSECELLDDLLRADSEDLDEEELCVRLRSVLSESVFAFTEFTSGSLSESELSGSSSLNLRFLNGGMPTLLLNCVFSSACSELLFPVSEEFAINLSKLSHSAAKSASTFSVLRCC